MAGLRWPDGPAPVTVWRIDGDHANSYAAWQRMGSPQPPTAVRRADLASAAALVAEPAGTVAVSGGAATAWVSIPR